MVGHRKIQLAILLQTLGAVLLMGKAFAFLAVNIVEPETVTSLHGVSPPPPLKTITLPSGERAFMKTNRSGALPRSLTIVRGEYIITIATDRPENELIEFAKGVQVSKWREHVGIEPTQDAERPTPVLKTGDNTSHHLLP